MPWYFSCKSRRSCGLVQNHPQDVVVFALNTATESGWLSPWDPPLQWGKVRKRIYRPATHPIHFAAVSPDKIHRYAAWAVFFFYGKRTLKISWADRTWYRLSVNAAAQTGAGTSFGANGDSHYMSRTTSTYFCILTIRKQLPGNDFERSGRGQEPSRGHKFSILENLCSTGTSLLQCVCISDVILLGRACPKPCLERTRRNCVNLTQFLQLIERNRVFPTAGYP